ncbi:alanine racemase [Streptococcus mitis]|uniref:Alanine racemase n=1 Tax=Streptococcus mitis TaxID=28037 RepID=A0A7X1RMZ5_STRMT|nr:alanine racemase [Streptococcus mitis]
MLSILESSKRNEDSHMTMTIKVNYQKTFQQEQAPSPKY